MNAPQIEIVKIFERSGGVGKCADISYWIIICLFASATMKSQRINLFHKSNIVEPTNFCASAFRGTEGICDIMFPRWGRSFQSRLECCCVFLIQYWAQCNFQQLCPIYVTHVINRETFNTFSAINTTPTKCISNSRVNACTMLFGHN